MPFGLPQFKATPSGPNPIAAHGGVRLGRIAPLQRSPREGPKSGRKPPFIASANKGFTKQQAFPVGPRQTALDAERKFSSQRLGCVREPGERLVRRLVCDFRHRFGIPALRVAFIIVCESDPPYRFHTDPVEIKRATEEGAVRARPRR
jgi:hypothetical protein